MESSLTFDGTILMTQKENPTMHLLSIYAPNNASLYIDFVINKEYKWI